MNLFWPERFSLEDASGSGGFFIELVNNSPAQQFVCPARSKTHESSNSCAHTRKPVSRLNRGEQFLGTEITKSWRSRKEQASTGQCWSAQALSQLAPGRRHCRHRLSEWRNQHTVLKPTHCGVFTTPQPHQPHPGAQSSAGLAPSHPLQILSVPR